MLRINRASREQRDDIHHYHHHCYYYYTIPPIIQSESVLDKGAVAWRINNSTSSHHQGKKKLNKQSLMICYQGCLVFRWPPFFWIPLGKGYLKMFNKRSFLTFSLCLVVVTWNKYINLWADCFISSFSRFHGDITKTWHSSWTLHLRIWHVLYFIYPLGIHVL